MVKAEVDSVPENADRTQLSILPFLPLVTVLLSFIQ